MSGKLSDAVYAKIGHMSWSELAQEYADLEAKLDDQIGLPEAFSAVVADLKVVRAKLGAMEKLRLAAEELLEVAELRGDNELLHPANDSKMWTARMQSAWDDLAIAYEEQKE